MEPIYHSNCNFVLGAGGIPNVQDVPACMVRNEDGSFNSIATFWKPTPEELKLLNEGGVMTLYVLDQRHPPVWLAVNHG